MSRKEKSLRYTFPDISRLEYFTVVFSFIFLCLLNNEVIEVVSDGKVLGFLVLEYVIKGNVPYHKCVW